MKKIENAEILCIGTELLLGDIVNTNASYLSQRMTDLGISVFRHSVVGDNPGRMRDAISSALGRSDLVIITGGLGPTCDDITKEITAEVFGRKLYTDEASLDCIKKYFESSGRCMTKNNEKQALIPEGAEIFPNHCGTAPGMALSEERGTVILLPGPPREMKAMFEESVVPYLENHSSSIILSKNINLFGIGESAAENILRELMESGTNPTLAPYASDGEVRLRVTAKASSKEQASEMCDKLISDIENTEIGKYIYGINATSLEKVLVDILRKKRMTISCAESCTGGLVTKRITDISGASAVFLGGAITYSNELKEKMLGVSDDLLEKYSPFSKETARAMAIGIRTLTGSNIAISTTGIAGPGGGTAKKPVGTVYVAISLRTRTEVFKLTLPSSQSREYIRTVAASNALFYAIKMLREL